MSAAIVTSQLPQQLDLPSGAALAIRQRLLRAASWSIGAAVVFQGLAFAASVITGRLLGPAVYGRLGVIQSTISVLAAFAELGPGLTTTKYTAQYRSDDPACAGRIIAMTRSTALISGGILAALLYWSAPLLTRSILRSPDITLLLRLSCPLLVVNALNGVFTGVLSGLERFRTLAGTNLLRGLATFPVTTLAVWLYGIQGAVVAQVVCAVLGCCFTGAAAARGCASQGIEVSHRGAFRRHRSLLWSFSFPAILGGLMGATVQWLANSLLARQPAGFTELGVFGAANQWRSLVVFIPMLLVQPVFALLANTSGEPGLREFRHLLWTATGVAGGLAAAVAAAGIVVGPWFLRAYGPAFAQGGPILLRLSMAAVVNTVATVLCQALTGLGKMWWTVGLNLLWAAAFLGTAWWLAQRDGALGLSSAMMWSYALHAAAVYACVLLLLGPVTGTAGQPLGARVTGPREVIQ